MFWIPTHVASTALTTVLLGPPVPPPPPVSAAPNPPPAATTTAPSTVAADASPSVLHPDLAAQAPQPEWTFEGGVAAPTPHDDTLDKKIRRSAIGVITGGSIALVGMAGTAAGGGMFASPKTSGYAPYVLYPSIGLAGTGVIVALVARMRLKRLREQRRGSAVAFGMAPTPGGFSAAFTLRF
jgi:hypothetical protein